jgi:hypothetical protein
MAVKGGAWVRRRRGEEQRRRLDEGEEKGNGRKGVALLGLCFVAEGLQGRSDFIMCEQVSSDLYQKGRSSKDTKVDTAPKL